jgi:hypothetical protein
MKQTLIEHQLVNVHQAIEKQQVVLNGILVIN